jgi:hypothetical protein
MDITLTALGFLIGSIVAGYILRALIRLAGSRWQRFGVEAGRTMSNIAFWGMLIVGLVLAVQVLAAPAVGDALASIISYGPALLAAVAVLALGHLLGVVTRDLAGHSARAVSALYEPLVRRTAYAAVMFIAVVVALGLIGVDVGWILNALVAIVVVVVASLGIAIAVGSIGYVQDLIAIRRIQSLIEPGMRIRVGNVAGRVVQIRDADMVLENDEGVVHLPGRYLGNRPVKVDTEVI